MTPETAFARVLDHALQELGAPLDRVTARLARHGATCSASTLSLWRRGRTRPAMPRSAPVLDALEVVLQLEPGSLHAALAEPDPSQPDWWTQRVPIHLFDDAQGAFEEFRAGHGLSGGDHLERLSSHVQVVMGPGRAPGPVTLSSVLRGAREGAQRLGAFHVSTDRTPDDQPVLFEVDHVVGGRVLEHVEFTGLGAIAALVELDRPLALGEITTLEVHWSRVTEAPPAPPTDFYEVRNPWPVGHLGLELCFEDELPRQVRAVRAARLAAATPLGHLPHEDVTPAPCVQITVDEVVGGGLRLEWTWDEETDAREGAPREPAGAVPTEPAGA